MNDKKLAYVFLAPTALVLILLVGYPIVYNLLISFQKVSLSLNGTSEFILFENYISVLTDIKFWTALATTLLYTFVVVVGSTSMGLFIAILFSRKFYFKKTANALILISYIVPSIASVYIFRYMFDINYGIINYYLVDVFNILDEAPLWFDKSVLSFILVSIFAIWRYFPYAYLSFYAILKTIDKSQYEAAKIDGATSWQIFKKITLPGVMPVLLTVVILRSIWMFYMYADVYLLTNQVDILGIYMYEKAFIFNDLGAGAAISIIMFALIFPFTKLIRKATNEGK